jgi:hypothetical protein
MESQNKAILRHMKAGKSITPLDALLKFGCMRLAARIYELKEAGHIIKDIRVKIRGSYVKRYSLGAKK